MAYVTVKYRPSGEVKCGICSLVTADIQQPPAHAKTGAGWVCRSCWEDLAKRYSRARP
jgi:hypothetical protein